MAQLLAPQALIADLQQTLQRRHPRPHPVRRLLLSGRLSKEQLQAWAKNQFHEFRNIHRFFGVRYQKCPVPELRRLLLENMVEEEGTFTNLRGRVQRFLQARAAPGMARPSWWVGSAAWCEKSSPDASIITRSP